MKIGDKVKITCTLFSQDIGLIAHRGDTGRISTVESDTVFGIELDGNRFPKYTYVKKNEVEVIHNNQLN